MTGQGDSGGEGGSGAGAIEIRTQRTPNPNAWKYILSRDVKLNGKASYAEAEQCAHVPLAAALFGLANVTQVHLFENVITVTQNGASDWQDLDPAVQMVLRREVPVHNPGFADEAPGAKAADRSLLPKEIKDIEEILDRTVRSALQADGGDLEVLELEGNILTVRFQGACGSCPSATFGTLQAIESVLRTEYNPYLEVVAV